MTRALGNNINVDFNTTDLRSICQELRDEQLEVSTSNNVLTMMEGIINDLQAERDKHGCTLTVLRDVLVALKQDSNTNALITDIEDYLKNIERR